MFDYICNNRIVSGVNYSQLECAECLKITNTMLERELNSNVDGKTRSQTRSRTKFENQFEGNVQLLTD